MEYLSVLTPPLLMCGAVVIAIVAFLRHEMRRSRRDQADEPGRNSEDLTDPAEQDDGRQEDGESSASRLG